MTVQVRRPSVDSRRHRKNLAHSDKTKHKKQIKTKETTGKQNKNLIDSFVVLRCNCATPLARSILGPGPHCTQCVVAMCYEAARAADSFNLACCHWKHHKESGNFDDSFFSLYEPLKTYLAALSPFADRKEFFCSSKKPSKAHAGKVFFCIQHRTLLASSLVAVRFALEHLLMARNGTTKVNTEES